MLTPADVRSRLRLILCQCLQLDPAELWDERPFLEVATSSLALVDAFSRISTEFGVTPSLRRIFHEFGTIADLSVYVAELAQEAERAGLAPPRPAPDGERLPFTPMMAWRHFLSELQPGPAWSEVAVVELRGALDVDALTAAWAKVVGRHEALRARLVEGEALVVAPEGPPLEVRWPDPSGAVDPAAWMRQLPALRPDDRLAAAELLILGADRALLRLTASVLVVDRPALLGLARELGQALGGEALAEAPSLASWMLRPASSGEADVAWWRERLAGRVSTDLPADKARPPVKRYTGRRLVVPLEAGALAPGADPLFGGTLRVLTALAVLAARITGADELVLGVSGAPLTEDRALVANRANPLPLALDLNLDAPLEQLQQQVRGALLEALDHAALPFARLVGALQPERDQGRSPLFTVAFDREVLPTLRFPGLDAGWVHAPVCGAWVDLQVRLVEGGAQPQLVVDFDDALFEAATVRRWLGWLRRALSAGPGPARAAPMWSADEEVALLKLGQGAESPVDDEPLHMPFFARAERDPAGVALVWRGERVTNAALADMALRVGARLEALGVGPGDRVGVCLTRRPEALAAILGTMAIGAVYVPLDPAFPPARLAATSADAGLSLTLCEDETAAALPPGARVERLSAGLPGLEQRLAAPARPSPDALAYLIYTSGSTGQPKGVAIPHRAARNLVLWAQRAFSPAELRRVLASTSFCFDLSIFEIFGALSGEGSLALVDTALDLWGLEGADEVTLINTVPSAMTELIRMGPLPGALRVVNLAGEPLRRALVDRIYQEPGVERVYNLYGPSETTTYSTWGLAPRGVPDEPTVGRPVANTDITLRDRAGALTPPGGIGEIVIGGAGVALGYFGRPDLSAERFVEDPAAPSRRAYRTGDFGRWLPSGELAFLGRRDAQVKVRGFRIELGAIEAALEAHPAVAEVAVAALSGSGGEKRIVAWLAREPSTLVVHAPDWRAWLGQRLPPYMVPAAFVELPALPRLPNGKLDRAALPPPDLDREARVGGDYAAPSDDLERTLATIWARQLGIDRVGVHDDFFALGGDSLLLTSLVLEIKGRLGIRVSLAEFFDCSTVSRLAARLRELARDRVNRAMVRRRIQRTGPEVDALFTRLEQDATLDAALRADPSAVVVNPRVLLVTGATGFVGAHTVYELLERADLDLRLMVRCRDAREGEGRVRRAMMGYGLWRDSYEGRFSVVPGDLGRPKLGMSEADWARLADEADAVLHMAATVNFLYPYHALRAINVGGVREVLRLCFERRPKALHYVSTAALWPMGAHLAFREDDDIRHGIRLNLGYDESKWVAEVLVGHARAAGLPVSVYRPGEVSGHSQTGQCVLDHFMFAIMKGSIQMGVFPDVKGFIDMAPVDYVARATAALLLDPASLGGTWQLNNPRPGDPRQMLRFLADYGYRFTTQSMEDWVATLMLREDLTENALYPFMAVLEEFEEENLQFPRYDTALARAALAPKGVDCPPVADELLRTYLGWFIEVGFLRPPS